MSMGLQRWFADPWALWLLLMLPVVVAFTALAWWQRRRARTLLGLTYHMPAPGRARRTVRSLFFTLGLILLVLGIASPQWGLRPVRAEDLATGRDLVVVLDLSRSMLAEQPSRQEQALAALKNLADALQARGGHRVALVVFAAHARLVFPLTTDYDYFRAALDQQDADNLLPALRPQKGETPGSGTRMGEALRAAVAAHDPNCKVAQMILLISDGDDPAGDEEWAQGAEAARSQGIPVYTVGIGDPETASPIPTRYGPLKHNGQMVLTRLEEKPLLEIARRTHGQYLGSSKRATPLGKWLGPVLDAPGPQRGGDAIQLPALPLYQPRYPWFLGTALACFAISLLMSGTVNPQRQGGTSLAGASG
jgi:Ca-activated chloride channel family protein